MMLNLHCKPNKVLPLLVRLGLAVLVSILLLAQPSISYAAACPAGAYWDGTTCISAPPGSYVPLLRVAATSATLCPVGTYQEFAGQSSCLPAPKGSYIDTVGATAANLCPKGAYQDQEGQSDCMLTPKGSYVDIFGAVMASPCQTGTFQNITGQRSCLPAPVGHYIDIIGAMTATAAKPCPPGAYQDLTGQRSCKPAPAGSYVAVTGANGPSLCLETRREYQDLAGQDRCKLAQTYGAFIVGDGATAPRCEIGYSLGRDNVTNEFICVPCPRGAICSYAGVGVAP